MKTALIVLAAVLAVPILLVAWRVGRIVFMLLFLRTAARRALGDVGRTAVARLPDRIHLVREEAPQWRHAAAVEEASRPLIEAGFEDVGTFSIPEMPGL